MDKKPASEEIGRIIREALERKGLSQSALAEILGHHETRISQFVTGKAPPTLADAGRLAGALGVSEHGLKALIRLHRRQQAEKNLARLEVRESGREYGQAQEPDDNTGKRP